jgi:serine/threonine-protein kinase ATR
VEFCPPQVWNPEILLKLLYLPNPYGKLTECIRLVVDKFGQSSISVDDRGDQGSFQEKSEIFDLTKVGQKRIAQNQENICYKRQKVSESQCSADSSTAKLFSAGIRHKLAKDYAYDLQLSLNSCIKFLSPDNHNAYPLEPEIAIKVLSLLCLSLCVNPKTSLFIRISKQVLSWIPWICKQVGRKHEAACI